MSQLLRFIYLSVAVLIASVSDAQWMQTNGPGKVKATSLGAIRGNVFAGTNGVGIFRSTDQGVNWTSKSSGLSQHWVDGLQIVDDNLFAITGNPTYPNRDVCLSTDQGDTWKTLYSFGMGTSSFNVMTVDNGKLFIGTSYQGIWYTSNLGASWQGINKFFGHTFGSSEIVGIAVKGNYLMVATGPNNDMSLSSDFGNTWVRISVGEKASAFVFVDTEIWVGCESGTIYRSTNYGVSWSRSVENVNGAVLSIVIYGSAAFVSTSNGVFKSTNHGLDWNKCGDLNQQFAFTIVNSIIVAATDQGFSCSSNSGDQWKSVNDGIVGSSCINTAGSNHNLLAAVGLDLFRSSDEGTSWKVILHANYVSISSFLVTDSFTFVENDRSILVKKSYGDDTWQDVTDNLPRYRITHSSGRYEDVLVQILSWRSFKDIIFAQTDFVGMIRSTNEGQSWTSISGDSPSEQWSRRDSLLFKCESGVISQSFDSGSTWVKVSNSIPNGSTVSALGLDKQSMFVTTKGGVIRSTDGGISWVDAGNGLQDSDITFLTKGDRVFAQSRIRRHIYVWLENASSWLPIDEGLNKSFGWGNITASDGFIFVGTDGLGVWKRSLQDFEPSISSPLGINSLTLYPNPSTSSANISFVTVAEGTVSVIIFDLMGKEVSSVFDGNLNAGFHYFNWVRPSGLSNGAYHCLVSMNGQTKHTMLILTE